MTESVIEASRKVGVTNRYGLHARPAAEFVKLASRFECEVWVEKDGLEVNGKSIMGVLMLAAEPGSTVRLRTVGEDAEEALDALAHLIEQGLMAQEEADDSEGPASGEES